MFISQKQTTFRGIYTVITTEHGRKRGGGERTEHIYTQTGSDARKWEILEFVMTHITQND